MASFLRHPKDFWSGIIFLAAGISAIVLAQDYSMGSAARMGPAYFPTILGGLLSIVGLIALIRSFVGAEGDAVAKFAIKELILVLAAVLLFGFLFRQAGLIIAIVVLVFVSAFASPKFKVVPTAMLAGGLAVFSWLVFVKLLGLPLPVLGPWFVN